MYIKRFLPKVIKFTDNLKKISKKRKLILIACVSIPIASIATLNMFMDNQYPQITTREIVEPEAPLNDKIKINPINKVVKENLKQDTINEPIINTAEQYIEELKFSEDSNWAVQLSWTSDPANIKNSTIKNAALPTLKLTLINTLNGNANVIEQFDVLNTDFINNNSLYFQKLGDEYGIYVYNLTKQEKLLAIKTSDPEFYKNVAFIDEDNYYFIQPKSGKYGYGKVSTGEYQITGEKLLTNETYLDVNKSLYSNLTISKDKKTISLIDASESKDFNKKLVLFDANDKEFKKPTFSAEVEVSFEETGSLKINKSKSEDDSLIIVGTDSTVIDIKNKKVLFKGEKSKQTKVNISPDNTKLIVCENSDSNKCKLKNLDGKDNKDIALLPDDISEMAWIDEDTALFTVGKSIYTFKSNSKKLEKAYKERGNYKILNKNKKDKSVVISKDDSIFKLQTNN